MDPDSRGVPTMSEYFLSFLPPIPEEWLQIPTEWPADPYQQVAYGAVALILLYIAYRIYHRLTTKRITNPMIFTEGSITDNTPLKL